MVNVHGVEYSAKTIGHSTCRTHINTLHQQTRFTLASPGQPPASSDLWDQPGQ